MFTSVFFDLFPTTGSCTVALFPVAQQTDRIQRMFRGEMETSWSSRRKLSTNCCCRFHHFTVLLYTWDAYMKTMPTGLSARKSTCG